MGISKTARDVVSAPLDPSRIKQRPGKGGKAFDFIAAEHVIELLNQAFDYDWSSRIVDSLQVDQDILVLLELAVNSDDGNIIGSIVKQQYGSSTLKSGVAPGDVYKSAATDALKKCATLLGIALELYRDEPATTSAPPQKASRPAAPAAPQREKQTTVPPGPESAAAPPRPPAPPRPAAAPAATDPAPAPSAEPAPASVPAPAARRAAVPATPAPTPPAPRANPFAKKSAGGEAGPNPTQLNALANLASKREVGESALIALANIVDEAGHPKQRFDDLSHSEAIQVIQASQR